jgi:hypothetical protein
MVRWQYFYVFSRKFTRYVDNFYLVRLYRQGILVKRKFVVVGAGISESEIVEKKNFLLKQT